MLYNIFKWADQLKWQLFDLISDHWSIKIVIESVGAIIRDKVFKTKYYSIYM